MRVPVRFHIGHLLVNPTSAFECGPILRSEMISLVMDDMLIHKIIQFVEIEEWNHRVAMVFGMKVGIPEQNSDQQIGSHTSGISEAVGISRYLTVGVFQVSEIIHHGVSEQDGDDPPEKHALYSFWCLAKQGHENDPVK